MKILWLSHLVPFPPKGGVLQRAYHMVRETARYHELHVLAFAQKDLFAIHFDNPDEALAQCRDGLSFCASLQVVDIPCDTVPFGKPLLAGASLLTRNPYTINWLWSPRFARAVSQTCREKDFDVVHFDTISLVPYVEQTGSIPATLDHHNVESQMMNRRAEIEPRRLAKAYFDLEGRKLEAYERRHCGRFETNMMCSDVDRLRLQAICPDARCSVIPNGVDTEYFRPGDDPGRQKSLVFAGRLSAYTNAQAARFIVTDIWPAVTERLAEVSMDLVGYNPPAEAVELARADARFSTPGFVDDVREYIDRAAIYVCPIFDGGGTKLKILDAMAMGKPIVATRVACEGIDLTDGESVMFAETGAEFAVAIERLLDDTDLRARLAANARRLAVDKYSYASIGRSLADTFGAIGGSKPATDPAR